MASSTVSSREFNQNASRVKKAAEDGPVFITERGRPSFVLLKIEEYRKIADKPEEEGEKPRTLIDLLQMPEGTEVFDFDFELEVPRTISTRQEVDFD